MSILHFFLFFQEFIEALFSTEALSTLQSDEAPRSSSVPRGGLDIQSSISQGNELRRLAFAPHLTIMAGCWGGVGWVGVGDCREAGSVC